jgi:hypothetical protein
MAYNARATCVEELELPPEVLKVELPLSGLMQVGVAEVRFSPAIQAILNNESQLVRKVKGEIEAWDAPKFDAVRLSFSKIHNVIAGEVLLQLRETLPDYDWLYAKGNGRGNAQGPMPAGAKTTYIHPKKYTEGWHEDIREPERGIAKKSFLEGNLAKFTLRLTIALPYGDMASTWAKPVNGLYKDKAVEVDPNSGIAFIMDFITHTTPRFEGEFRGLYIFDFEASKKV